MDLRTSTAGSLSAGGPIAIMFQVVLKRPTDNHFTFAWHNSTGAVKEGVAPDGNWGPEVGANVFDLFEALPKTDLEIGSVSTAGLQTNALRDAIMYHDHLRPLVFMPGHMTTGTNGVGQSSSPELYWTYKAIEGRVRMGARSGAGSALAGRSDRLPAALCVYTFGCALE
jgi:hypothetical protein